jgi:hypothetical protein
MARVDTQVNFEAGFSGAEHDPNATFIDAGFEELRRSGTEKHRVSASVDNALLQALGSDYRAC